VEYKQRFGNAVFSRHAVDQMHRRGSTEMEVRAAMARSENVDSMEYRTAS
jgi:hypothetical protein